MNKKSRPERIEFKVDTETKNMITQLAQKNNMTLSQYVRKSAIKSTVTSVEKSNEILPHLMYLLYELNLLSSPLTFTGSLAHNLNEELTQSLAMMKEEVETICYILK